MLLYVIQDILKVLWTLDACVTVQIPCRRAASLCFLTTKENSVLSVSKLQSGYFEALCISKLCFVCIMCCLCGEEMIMH